MSQNSERLHWTFEEVDGKLKGIMETIYANISDAAKRYNATVGGKTDYVAGANIAGFEKVVDMKNNETISRCYVGSGRLLIAKNRV
jgi:glutamate dehydrogenase (NADP+)